MEISQKRRCISSVQENKRSIKKRCILRNLEDRNANKLGDINQQLELLLFHNYLIRTKCRSCYKSGKAIEIFELLGENNIQTLTKLSNEIYNTGTIPTNWLKTTFVIIPKKNKATKCKCVRSTKFSCGVAGGYFRSNVLSRI